MKKRSKIIKLMADFETSVYDGQDKTEVWAAALVPIGRNYDKKDVQIENCIQDFFTNLKDIVNKNSCSLVVYFHNLKFDGSFILDYLIKNHYQQTFYRDCNGNYFKRPPVSSSTFSYNISEQGQWYSINLKYRKYVIEFRDSLKLLPFTVSEIGEAFQTKYRKGKIEYMGERHAGGEITPEERDYIANDVLVVKEALESLFEEGHDSLTIGACCFKQWKTIQGYGTKEMFRSIYPDLTQYMTPWGETCDAFIRKAYKGGWCYLNPKYEGQEIKQSGLTVDANSMYSSNMHSQSGNRYCYGAPKYFYGLPNNDIIDDKNTYFFIRFKCSFNLKPGMLPTVQIKGDSRYVGSEWLTTSNYKAGNMIIKNEVGPDGNVQPVTVTLTMTETDFVMFLNHYDVKNFEAIGGCYFKTNSGEFDKYIDYYMDRKMTSRGAKRQIAKLFLNNLYGKLSASRKADNQVINDKDLECLHFETMESEKEPGYIAIGAQVTSYSRALIIKYAQTNIDRFIYADTDSLHMIGEEDPDGIPLDDVKLGYWKVESHWNNAIFVRQKTYIEHITDGDGYYNVKCCGMTSKLKDIISYALEDKPINLDIAIENGYNESEIEFINHGMKISDFTHGFEMDGQLKAKRINGGTILQNGKFKIK